ncbi:hypothetical protein DPX16_8835 [Anabarilius grahami]|uniref:C1q domain-containing protein n=1 Tax=Anabarilius grahami TaxID=495550 RepID=A0A3N0YDV8_ANAGA|nr:hypothetical protein DPX16_8835 [Anabarilius grahami]
MRLLKNSRSVLSATDNAPRHNDEDTTCYSVSLLLEQGDGIHLQLMENHKIYTDIFHRNTFSGHLLFTV